MAATGWAPILDAGNPIGLQHALAAPRCRWSRPASSSCRAARWRRCTDTAAELDAHLAQVRAVAGPLGLGFAPLGFHPTMRRDQMPWMPKSRYAIMRRYMPLVGSLGWT